jgi:integrase
MGLSHKRVARLTKSGRYADGNRSGLYLQITPTGTKNWLFRFELRHRERFMGLGSARTFSLQEARERARKARQLLADGIDPIDHRNKTAEARAVEAAKDKTFAEVATAYLRAHGGDWKNAKHAAQWKTSLTKETKAIANLPVAAINTAHVLEVLEPIWRTKPETASRIRGRIERVLAYAIAAEYRKREDGNPARWDGHLQELLGSKAKAQKAKRERTGKSDHHAALPYTEVPPFMTRLRQNESISAKALEFLILTAARTGEVIGATWEEVDLTEKVWTVGASRMKAGKEHRVPLSARAVKVLQSLPREDDNPYLFIGGKTGAPLSNMAMLELMKGMRPGYVPHGFRSSLMDWAHERTAFPKVAIDLALAHTVGDKVEAAYRRGDLFEKRRRLMAEWARYCTSKPSDLGAVIPLQRKATPQ